ncbi:phage tail protein [Robbsia sp. KACC 23696]|uniref:phage tail protein n=1 Tax=Robbsia sp. KACC 23696 TaxID=3149231 RepID=UPI00325BC8D5
MNRESLFEPEVGYRFVVGCFFRPEGTGISGVLGSALRLVPSPLDFRFQRVSGLQRQVQTSSFRQGGDNVATVFLPERVTHGNLVLERGVMTLSPLTMAFADAMSRFQTHPCDVVVSLLNHQSLPISTWTFINAIPVGWRTGDLDASSSSVLVNSLELAYREMHFLGIKA